MTNMTKVDIRKWVTYFVAMVWIANGLLCKVLNLVPRHQEIVSKILSIEDARLCTVLIGIAETAMGVWILSGILTRLNAITQITIIATMNVLEFILVPDLLLWGKFNALFAGMFILLIFYNEFILANKIVHEV
jgi:DoxX-like protein